MNQTHSANNPNDKKNERGGALVTSLLVATILLVAGGALIQITSMSAANAPARRVFLRILSHVDAALVVGGHEFGEHLVGLCSRGCFQLIDPSLGGDARHLILRDR